MKTIMIIIIIIKNEQQKILTNCIRENDNKGKGKNGTENEINRSTFKSDKNELIEALSRMYL